MDVKVSSRRERWLVRGAIAGIFALFMGVRIYHLDTVPAHNDTTDEYAWTWSGMTLLQTGTPRAWSNLRAYAPHHKRLKWRDHKYNMVEPWLDHPPIYSLYAGGWIMAWGHRDIFDVDLWQMRTGTLPLAALSFICLAAFLRRYLTPAAVLLSLLFYALLPLIVWQHKLVVSENLFVPLTLVGLLLIDAQAVRFAGWRALALLVLATLLPLIKAAALSCCALLVFWALASNARGARWLNAGALALGTCAGIAGYLWWGRHFNAGLFEGIMAEHQARFRGFQGLQVLLFEPVLIAKATKDMLAILGAVLALQGLTQREPAPWGLAVLVYAGCMTFFVGDNRIFGWYFIPLHPWLCAALGSAIVRATRERLLGLSVLWYSAALLAIAALLYDKRLMAPETMRVGYLLAFLVVPGAWLAWPRLARATIPALNGAMVLGTVLACLYEIYVR